MNADITTLSPLHQLPKEILRITFDNFSIINCAKIAIVCRLFNENAKKRIQQFRLLEKYANTWRMKTARHKYWVPESRREFLGYTDHADHLLITSYANRIPATVDAKRRFCRCDRGYFAEFFKALKPAESIKGEAAGGKTAEMSVRLNRKCPARIEPTKIEVRFSIPRIMDFITNFEITGVDNGCIELHSNNFLLARKTITGVKKNDMVQLFDYPMQLPIRAMVFCNMELCYVGTIPNASKFEYQKITDSIIAYQRGFLTDNRLAGDMPMNNYKVPFVEQVNPRIDPLSRTQKIKYLLIEKGYCPYGCPRNAADFMSDDSDSDDSESDK